VKSLGIELHHEQERQVVKAGRDHRHPDHVEIADVEELGDQKGGGTQNRRRDDGAEAAGCEQAAGRVLLEAGLLHHRIGDGADGHGGGDAGAGWSPEQKGRQDHRAAGAVGLVPHERHRKIDEELARPGMLQERAIDREQDDQRGRHVDGNAENALERDEQMADELRDVVAAMRPWRGQIGAGKRVRHEQDRHDRHDPAGGAPRGFKQQDNENQAEHDVEAGRHGRTVGEFLAALDGINEDRHADDASGDVPPADAVAEPSRQRKYEKAQHQHEGDVGVAQRLGRDDREVGERPRARDRGVEVKQRHRDRDRRDQPAGPADQAIDHALLGLDIGLRFLQLLSGNGGLGCLARLRRLRHVASWRSRFFVALVSRRVNEAFAEDTGGEHKARSAPQKPDFFSAVRPRQWAN
jgi:hypothetical protein